jgi:hypothetical protein
VICDVRVRVRLLPCVLATRVVVIAIADLCLVAAANAAKAGKSTEVLVPVYFFQRYCLLVRMLVAVFSVCSLDFVFAVRVVAITALFALLATHVAAHEKSVTVWCSFVRCERLLMRLAANVLRIFSVFKAACARRAGECCDRFRL